MIKGGSTLCMLRGWFLPYHMSISIPLQEGAWPGGGDAKWVWSGVGDDTTRQTRATALARDHPRGLVYISQAAIQPNSQVGKSQWKRWWLVFLPCSVGLNYSIIAQDALLLLQFPVLLLTVWPMVSNSSFEAPCLILHRMCISSHTHSIKDDCY